MAIARVLGQRGPYIDYTKTISIAAPIEEVFSLWQNFENFPQFMRNVRAVRRNTENGWHWEVAGLLGATVQWDAEMTVCIPNELIAWSTMPGSQVQHAGLVHFQREGDGTRIQVEMGYNPPGAALGHVVASLFGSDPLTEMDEDLMRMKVFLETGKPARDAAAAAAAPATEVI
ncbi:MAG: SRPBCC family protein [Betaproteobacteria bacterium]